MSLREQMPTCAAWIDDLRAAFGTETIDAAIRQGRKQGGFCAEEAGHVVGKGLDWTEARVAVLPAVEARRKR